MGASWGTRPGGTLTHLLQSFKNVFEVKNAYFLEKYYKNRRSVRGLVLFVGGAQEYFLPPGAGNPSYDTGSEVTTKTHTTSSISALSNEIEMDDVASAT